MSNKKLKGIIPMNKRQRKKLADNDRRSALEAFEKLSKIWDLTEEESKALLVGDTTYNIGLLIIIYDTLMRLYDEDSLNVTTWPRRPFSPYSSISAIHFLLNGNVTENIELAARELRTRLYSPW